jgi:hypothetical protein
MNQRNVILSVVCTILVFIIALGGCIYISKNYENTEAKVISVKSEEHAPIMSDLRDTKELHVNYEYNGTHKTGDVSLTEKNISVGDTVNISINKTNGTILPVSIKDTSVITVMLAVFICLGFLEYLYIEAKRN